MSDRMTFGCGDLSLKIDPNEITLIFLLVCLPKKTVPGLWCAAVVLFSKYQGRIWCQTGKRVKKNSFQSRFSLRPIYEISLQC